MTTAAAPDVEFFRGGWPRRLTQRAPVAAACLAAAAGLVARATGTDAALTQSGPVLLAVAFVLGVPHGALDTDFLPARDVRTRMAGVSGYAGLALLTFLAWTRWPAAVIAALLVVSAAHFAATDLAFGRARSPGSGARATGRSVSVAVAAVAGPFACWPRQTSALLAELGVHDGASRFSAVATVLLVVALAVGLVATIADVRAGDGLVAAEPAAVLLLVWACPPLVAFAVYFGAWHALRQTVRVVAVHPRSRVSRSALRPVAVRALAAGVVAAAVLAIVVALHGGVGAAVLVALLALSVPHALTDAVRDVMLIRAYRPVVAGGP